MAASGGETAYESYFTPLRNTSSRVKRLPWGEQFYQLQKSLDPRYYTAIRACQTPAKRLATFPEAGSRDKRSWFVGRRSPRPNWMDINLDLMRCADTAKYTQNANLTRRLLATGEAEIVEDAKHDSFRGIGRDGTGENWADGVIRTAMRVVFKNDLLVVQKPDHPQGADGRHVDATARQSSQALTFRRSTMQLPPYLPALVQEVA